MLTILFDGIAYGMLLFVLACGLSVTLGLMNFVNLAHGAFAMAGGYLTVVMVNRMGFSFFLALPLAFLLTAMIGGLFERTLYVQVYQRTHLDQVLFTIGLVFMSVAAVDYVMGSSQQFVQIPQILQGQIDLFGIGVGRYRLLIIIVCGVLTLALQLILTQPRVGSRLRAAVGDPRVARGLGINVNAVFGLTFAFGSGLAGLGGALGAEILGLDPIFPLKYMIYFLIVVTVGGTSSITGPFLASILLGIGDVAGKYYVPTLGAFVIYTIMIVLLIWRPQALFARGTARYLRGGKAMSRKIDTAVTRFLASRARFGPFEIVFWLTAFATIYLLPGRHLILTETAIWGLFALSLDLILGYAGIISLGHAAFFGVGAYAAGLLAKHEIIVEPSIALLAAGLAAAALGFATSFLVLRGSDLTRLMVTLGVALVCFELANKFGELTGGADGLQGVSDHLAPVFGVFRFDLFGHNAYIYTLAWLFVMFVLARRIVNSPFGLSLKAIKGNALRSSAIGIAVNWRLIAIYTLSAGYAGIAGGLLAQTQAFASLSMLSIDRSADVLLILIIGGPGYLYGGLIGALIYRFLQDYPSDPTARYWQFWFGLLLVAIGIVGRERIGGWTQLLRGFVVGLFRRSDPNSRTKEAVSVPASPAKEGA